MIDKLVILHEYGAPRHFQALYYLAQQRGIKIESGEFDLRKQVGRLILRRPCTSLHRLLYNVNYLLRLCRISGQQVIVGATPYDPVISLLLKIKEKNKVIYLTSWPYWDGERYPKKPLHPRQKKLWHNFLRGIRVVTATKAAQQAILRHGANAVHIPHCVDTQIFKPGELIHHQEDKVRVLFVGQLIRRKGVRRLIELIEKNPWAGVEFWFVGRGPYESRLIELEDRFPIRYLGFIRNVKQLANIYREADIFVLPSIESDNNIEPFGIVLLEAMASGLPLVTTDCIGPREIADDGVNGYIVSQDDTSALRDALDELIKDPAKRAKFGACGRHKVETVYSVSKIAERWAAILEPL